MHSTYIYERINNVKAGAAFKLIKNIHKGMLFSDLKYSVSPMFTWPLGHTLPTYN